MRALIFAVIMMLAAPTYAAEFLKLQGTKTIVMLGDIEPSDVLALDKLLQEDVNEIYLSSPGGNLDTAWRLGKLVNEKGVKISLTENVSCASACAILFFHAAKREMANGSRLGVHLPYFGSDEAFSPDDVCRATKSEVNVQQREIAKTIASDFPGLMGSPSDHKVDPDAYELLASHILVDSKAEALAIVEKLNMGHEFSSLASKYSNGPSGPNGGALGWFGAGAMVDKFEEAVFSLQVREYTQEPIKTQFGWHIIHLQDTRLKSEGPSDSGRIIPERREARASDLDCLTSSYQIGAMEFLRISDLLTRMGIDQVVLRTMLATPSDEISWLNEKMADKLGILVE